MDLKPYVLTGSNCKLIVNGVLLAYATDLQYNIEISHEPATLLGSYEPDFIEPTAYMVQGSFTVIRYVWKSVDGANVTGGATSGNGIGNWTPNKGDFGAKALGAGMDGQAYRSLNPAWLKYGMMFDIEIYQTNHNPEQTLVGKPDRLETGIQGYTSNTLGVARIRDARINSAGLSVSKKSPAVQKFTFLARYADEDSFLAGSSK